MEHPSQEEW
jgi:hypothetical protein